MPKIDASRHIVNSKLRELNVIKMATNSFPDLLLQMSSLSVIRCAHNLHRSNTTGDGITLKFES